MRRMMTNGQIVNTVNAAIESGEIQAGGVTPQSLYENLEGSETVVVDLNEDETAVEIHLDNDVTTKIENSLQKPLTTPTEQELVGIDTTGAQNRITIGDGLAISNGELIVNKLVLNFNRNASYVVTQDIADKINDGYYDSIIIKNYNDSGCCLRFVLADERTNVWMQGTSIGGYYTGEASGATEYVLDKQLLMQRLSPNTGTLNLISNTGFNSGVGRYEQASLKLNSSTLALTITFKLASDVGDSGGAISAHRAFRQQITDDSSLSGTIVSVSYSGSSLGFADLCITWRVGSMPYQDVLFKAVTVYKTRTTAYVVLKGELTDYDAGTITTYLMKFTPSTGAYEVKTIQ